MSSKVYLILRRPQGGRLEGRTTVDAACISISSQAPERESKAASDSEPDARFHGHDERPMMRCVGHETSANRPECLCKMIVSGNHREGRRGEGR
jgi:hypothetical protein